MVKKKVILAMSGGVDSSLAAFLLKKEGFDVSGLFFRLNSLESSFQSEEKAKMVATEIGIPFSVLDLRKEFKEKVINYFIGGYKKGLTPNPCVICNKEIKFAFLFKELRKRDADFVATGHYAAIKDNNLVRGIDKNKDQSYFLWQLGYKMLERILFPLGNLKKEETKKIAGSFGLPFSDVRESQEICFIDRTTEYFLKKVIGIKRGKIIDENGHILGEHNGIWFYTIGQRKGIRLSGGPYWALKKKIKENILVVTKNENNLYNAKFIGKNLNWLLKERPKNALTVSVQLRYRHKPSPAVVKVVGDAVEVSLSRPEKAITPGQSVVFYKNNRLLGGAYIDGLLE